MPKDLFSKQAGLYAKFRPHYPQELYEFIYSKVARFDKAWDCATGNGQVARILSDKFKEVYATDISQQQLDHAYQKPNITYSRGSAEHSGLTVDFDLITVAQALHWFDTSAFWKEICKLSHKETILAYWMYGLPTINHAIDEALLHFHDHTVGPYWDEARDIWRTCYEVIDFPLHGTIRKSFAFEATWSLAQMEGYLSSWSSVQKYMAQHKKDPVASFIHYLKPLWNGDELVNFPIFLTLGRVV